MRHLAIIGLAALLVLGLLGCSSAAPAAPKPAEAPKAQPTAAPGAPAAQAPKEQPKAATTDFPTKPINFIIPYAAGGASDLTMRFLADGASKLMNNPIMVVNKGGGSGALGLKDIMDSKPDGYTIGSHVGLSTNKLTGASPYDQRDVSMIAVTNSDSAVVVVYSERPFKTIKDLIDYAKANPEKVTLSTNSKGSAQWIAAKVFEHAAGVTFRIIPEPEAGASSAIKVAGGHVDLAVASFANFKTQLESGTIRLLTLLGPKRIGGKYSDIPTMDELGMKTSGAATLRCVIGPKGLTGPVYDKLVHAFGEAAKDPEYQKKLLDLEVTPVWWPGAEGVKAYDEQEKLFYPILENAGLLKK